MMTLEALAAQRLEQWRAAGLSRRPATFVLCRVIVDKTVATSLTDGRPPSFCSRWAPFVVWGLVEWGFAVFPDWGLVVAAGVDVVLGDDGAGVFE